MTTRNFSLIMTAIMTMTLTTGAQELDRTKRPEPQKLPRIELPDIQKATLRNGLSVWLVGHHELPTVSLNLVIRAGSDHDPLDLPGVASMTADLLDEGTTSRDALQIADDLDFIGATLRVGSGFDATFMTLNTLTKHLDRALEVYADVLINPTFPQKEFDRVKQERLTSLLQQKDRASTIASLAFNRVLYGSGHPYGNDPSGSEESITALTRNDLVRFYESRYRPNNATLIVVGDVKLPDVRKRLERHLAGWKSASIAPMVMPPTPAVDTRRVYLIDKPGAPQSELRLGYPALARSTPDFFPVMVMNRILGGQFSSRINLNLRERHGFTYGARTSFVMHKHPGPFVASAGVTTAKTDSSIREFLYELDLMRKEGMTPEELAFAKKGLSGAFSLAFETQAQVAGALQNIVLYNLPENYYETYLQSIDRVTLDDVRRVAGKYLDTSRMAVVVVGDLKEVREGIEKLQLGESILCDVRGKPLSP